MPTAGTLKVNELPGIAPHVHTHAESMQDGESRDAASAVVKEHGEMLTTEARMLNQAEGSAKPS
jgi:hypothetical protein